MGDSPLITMRCSLPAASGFNTYVCSFCEPGFTTLTVSWLLPEGRSHMLTPSGFKSPSIGPPNKLKSLFNAASTICLLVKSVAPLSKILLQIR